MESAIPWVFLWWSKKGEILNNYNSNNFNKITTYRNGKCGAFCQWEEYEEDKWKCYCRNRSAKKMKLLPIQDA